MAGETGPIDVTLAVAMVIAGFFAVSVYNSIEILVWTVNCFKRHHLYSQSMIVAAVGIFVHSVAALLRFFALAPSLPMCVFIVLGWWAMVTGQSVVMYSRLHLVISDGRKIRYVRNMIITNFFILHLPVSVLFFGSNSTNPEPFVAAFNVYEKIQLAGFTIQETIISGLYAWEVVYSLRPILEMKGAEGRKMIIHIFILFIVVVVLDATLMAAQYTDNFQIQTTYKPVVYSVKLKFEFAILNRLMAFTRLRLDTSGVTGTISRTTTDPRLYAMAKDRAERYDDDHEILELEFPERPSKTRASSRSLGSTVGTAL